MKFLSPALPETQFLWQTSTVYHCLPIWSGSGSDPERTALEQLHLIFDSLQATCPWVASQSRLNYVIPTNNNRREIIKMKTWPSFKLKTLFSTYVPKINGRIIWWLINRKARESCRIKSKQVETDGQWVKGCVNRWMDMWTDDWITKTELTVG